MTDLQTQIKRRETAARRAATRLNLAVFKNRARDVETVNLGGFMLVDAAVNFVVAGGGPLRFCLSLDDLEQELREHA